MRDIWVKVFRVHQDKTSQSLDGYFLSKVYSIEGKMFLVYDDGRGSAQDDYVEGFVWVDCTEKWNKPFPDGVSRPVVELWECGE